MPREVGMENVLKGERKILRIILGGRLTKNGYRLTQKKATERLSNVTTDMRKIM